MRGTKSIQRLCFSVLLAASLSGSPLWAQPSLPSSQDSTTGATNVEIAQFLERLEGRSSTAYQVEGLWHVGVGMCIDKHRSGCGLREEEIDWLTQHRVEVAKQELAKEFSWFYGLDPVRKAVVVSMHWQVGNLKLWPRFANAMAVRDYGTAAKEMLDSVVARNRSTRPRWELQAKMMRTGQW